MNPQEFLQPDHRWTVWGCQCHEEYLEKYFLPGKFHPAVPDKVKEAYQTVERLIAYSYFYYPMTEEASSKISRVFEMAVRLRAQQLGIATTNIKKGRSVPTNLSILIQKLREFPESDQDWADEWVDFKSLRNMHAHPEGPNYGGAINLMSIVPMVNIINSLFIPAPWFQVARSKAKALQDSAAFYTKGVYVLSVSDTRYIITSAVPILVSHDELRSIWIMEPVGLKFPQTMDEYFEFKPFVFRLTELSIDEDGLRGRDYIHDKEISILPSDHPADLEYTKVYLQQMNSAEEQVRIFHNQHFNYHLYTERERFMYDEFWDKDANLSVTN